MKPTLISWIAGAISLGSLATCLILWFSMPRIGMVDNAQLMEGFTGTQEARSELKARYDQQQFFMDSLKVEVQQAERQVQEKTPATKTAYSASAQRYQQMSQLYQRELAGEEQRLFQGVSQQLSAYVQAYGEAKGYDCILGASGNGNMWYLRPAVDLTEEVMVYANQQYEGR